MWLALSPPNPSFYRDEHLFVDLYQPVVILDGETVRLTPIQYRLLVLVVGHAGEVVPRATVFTQLWGYAPQGCSKLDAHLWRRRKKLGIYGRQYIETVRRVGYRHSEGLRAMRRAEEPGTISRVNGLSVSGNQRAEWPR